MKPTFNRFSKKWTIGYLVFSLLYFLWFAGFIGLNTGHVAVYIAITICVFSTAITRNLMVAISPFICYLFGYDSLRVLHEYELFPIINEVLYNMEKNIFGVQMNGSKVTLNEYFLEHQNIFLDLLSGLFYISWVPFPVAFTLYLFFTGRRGFCFRFWTCFLIANLFGFAIYILLPAAPPWYYLEYGAEIMRTAGGQPAGLIKFDELIGIPIYQNMYNAGTNTFGALPSMHAAFPLILTYYSLRVKKTWMILLFGLSMISIWIGAVYTSHHYVIDMVMGIACGVLGLLITEWLFNKNPRYRLLREFIVRTGEAKLKV